MSYENLLRQRVYDLRSQLDEVRSKENPIVWVNATPDGKLLASRFRFYTRLHLWIGDELRVPAVHEKARARILGLLGTTRDELFKLFGCDVLGLQRPDEIAPYCNVWSFQRHWVEA